MTSPTAPAPATGSAPKYILPSRRSVLLMAFVAVAGVLLILRAWQIGPFQRPTCVPTMPTSAARSRCWRRRSTAT
jgi:hypothetical protein